MYAYAFLLDFAMRTTIRGRIYCITRKAYFGCFRLNFNLHEANVTTKPEMLTIITFELSVAASCVMRRGGIIRSGESRCDAEFFSQRADPTPPLVRSKRGSLRSCQ